MTNERVVLLIVLLACVAMVVWLEVLASYR